MQCSFNSVIECANCTWNCLYHEIQSHESSKACEKIVHAKQHLMNHNVKIQCLKSNMCLNLYSVPYYIMHGNVMFKMEQCNPALMLIVLYGCYNCLLFFNNKHDFEQQDANSSWKKELLRRNISSTSNSRGLDGGCSNTIK